MGSTLNSETKASIGIISRQIFYELAMHHHHYIMAGRFRNEELPGQDPEYQAHYFRLVVSQNYGMLALTLCKVMEFHTAFRSQIVADLRDELDSVNSRLARSRILDYRNKYVGHIFDRRTKKPLHPTAILGYWEALLEGQDEEQFRAWWWSTRREPELRSVAGLMVRIADSLGER
jgi:hypothetical protein